MTVNSTKSLLHIGALQEFQDWILERILPVLKKNNTVLKLFGILLKIIYKRKMQVLNLLPVF